MKDIAIRITAEVEGQKSIEQLADELEDMAKVAGGDLQAAAREAAARLRELGQQDAAITAFLELQRGAKASQQAMRSATQEAANYAAQIAKAGPPTVQEAAALQRLEAAAEGARTEFARQTDALAAAQAGLQRYGIAGQNAQAAQTRLRQEVDLVRNSVKDIAPAYGHAAAGAQEAGATMVRTHRQIGDGVESISQQLARLQGFMAGLAGLQGFKAMATDLARTADQMNNLQARLKLVTGEGEAFGAAWAGVQGVALRTNSALEETGTLFTRIAQVGKDAGQSGTQAVNNALALTETINQAIQLSGASAQASSAAITQLVQGLQGGVLRGDEFNSVMEQAPRLARALADSLGVTTGELRKLAEEGRLTSETVINALQGQGQVIAAEFEKLPPTVGRAMQNLSTQWDLYVAGMDGATGASKTAAEAINALARNLSTIAGLLMDAGQAAAAFAALRLAQQFLGIGTAATQAAAAVAAHNAQLVASGTVANVAAASAGRFASVLAGLRTFTLLGLVVNFKDIGTWIGESAAKLAGYKDRTEELTRVDKLAAEAAKETAAARARLAAATQAAIDKQFELSKAARLAVIEFDRLTKAGTDAGDALAKVVGAFDLRQVSGINDFAAVLDKLVADGKFAAEQVGDAWAKALEGKDLAQFEVMARTAFAGSAREAERLAQVMDAALREAVRRSGLSFDELQGKVGAASRSAINDVDMIIQSVDRLKTEGVNASTVLAASFVKAIDTADSVEAINALLPKIEEVRTRLGSKIADGLLDQAEQKVMALEDRLDKLMPGINSVREAFKTLRIQSDADLKGLAADAKASFDYLAASGEASARELSVAFKRAAEQAIAANDGIAPEWVKSQAAVRGFKIEVDSTGKATVVSMRDAAEAVRGVGHAARQAAGEFDYLGQRIDYTSERARLLHQQGQILAATLEELNARTAASSITNRKDNINPVDAVPQFDSMEQAEAWLQEWKRQYAAKNPFTTKSGGQLGNFQLATTMAEWQAEVDAMRLRDAMKKPSGGQGAGAGSGTAPVPAPAPAAPQPPAATGGARGSGVSAAPINITMNVNGVTDPARLARMLQPELVRLARLAR